MKKKGDVIINTLVIIILAIVALVVLIYGFNVGWGNFFEQITGLGGSQVNVQTNVQSCQISCSTNSDYDYCQKLRTVVFNEDKKDPRNNRKYTCLNLVSENVGLTSCDTINCGVIGNGLCSGVPDSSKCGVQNDRGKSNCESITGCIWVDDLNPNDNIGNCEISPDFSCASLNNNKVVCERAGCQWQS